VTSISFRLTFKSFWDLTEGLEADQLLVFERLYLQVGACVSQRFNQNTKQLTADQHPYFELSHIAAYVHKIKIKPPSSEFRLKNQI